MERCNILGVDVNVTDMNKTIKYICDNLEEIKGDYICVSNVHTTVMAYEDEKYRKIQNSGAMVLPDGAPLSFISRKYGFKEAKRVTGPDLMGEIFNISLNRGYKHYFYGSTEGTLRLLMERLKKSYPGICIVGMYSPPFRDLSLAEQEYVVKDINDKNPDFVWVGLGAPKQEIWMSNNKNKINAVMIGVGAGFDYYAGNIKRAPKWMQKCSLEWLYRLFQEPKRLFKRYFYSNIKFIVNVIKLRKK